MSSMDGWSRRGGIESTQGLNRSGEPGPGGTGQVSPLPVRVVVWVVLIVVGLLAVRLVDRLATGPGGERRAVAGIDRLDSSFQGGAR